MVLRKKNKDKEEEQEYPSMEIKYPEPKIEKRLVEFWAEWCGPCGPYTPIVEQVARELDLPLSKIDVDKEPSMAKNSGVQSVPTLLLFETVESHIIGKITHVLVGARGHDELLAEVKTWL